MTRLLLPATALLLLFANGRWAVGIVAWIAPALLVRFMRTRPLRVALPGGLLAMSVANYVWWLDVFPLRGVSYAIASIVLGFVTLVPWLLDRRLAPRLPALASTLVLPATAVSIELLQSIASPFGSWGSFAYSQASHLPLLQLLSITGLSGITFLLLWFAALVNRWWEARFAWGAIRGSVVLFAAILAAVLLFGTLRLRSGDAAESVRVAAITPRVATYTVRGEPANRAISAALSSVRRRERRPAAQWEAFRVRAAEIDDELLAATEAEAREGAALVVWSEGAGIVETQDEPALLARAASVAQRNGVWIQLAFLVLDRRGSATFENKSVLVDASGRTVWTYHKSHPVPGLESCVPGDGDVPVAPTPFGRVATVICYDADFPRLVRKAGMAGADLLLLPADDWREIAALHASMARFRAVEQGFSIVRATSNGYSLVVDRYGRVRASVDSTARMQTLRADVPRRGARTPYARWGDLAGWIAVALLAALLCAPLVAPAPALNARRTF